MLINFCPSSPQEGSENADDEMQELKETLKNVINQWHAMTEFI